MSRARRRWVFAVVDPDGPRRIAAVQPARPAGAEDVDAIELAIGFEQHRALVVDGRAQGRDLGQDVERIDVPQRSLPGSRAELEPSILSELPPPLDFDGTIIEERNARLHEH